MDAQEFWLTLAAVVVPTLAAVVSALLLHRSNRDAHAGIVQRIAGVDQSSVDRDEAHRRAIAGVDQSSVDRDEAHRRAIAGVDQSSVDRDEAHRRALESIARDVSFMAGRQTERDQAGR